MNVCSSKRGGDTHTHTHTHICIYIKLGRRYYKSHSATKFCIFFKFYVVGMKKLLQEKEHIQKYCLHTITVFEPAGRIVVHLYYMRISSSGHSVEECATE